MYMYMCMHTHVHTSKRLGVWFTGWLTSNKEKPIFMPPLHTQLLDQLATPSHSTHRPHLGGEERHPGVRSTLLPCQQQTLIMIKDRFQVMLHVHKNVKAGHHYRICTLTTSYQLHLGPGEGYQQAGQQWYPSNSPTPAARPEGYTPYTANQGTAGLGPTNLTSPDYNQTRQQQSYQQQPYQQQPYQHRQPHHQQQPHQQQPTYQHQNPQLYQQHQSSPLEVGGLGHTIQPHAGQQAVLPSAGGSADQGHSGPMVAPSVNPPGEVSSRPSADRVVGGSGRTSVEASSSSTMASAVGTGNYQSDQGVGGAVGGVTGHSQSQVR